MKGTSKKQTLIFYWFGLVIISLLFVGCSPDEARIKRAFREYQRGDFDYAIRNFNLALRENPQSIEAYVGLAFSWEKKKDYVKADEYYCKALDIESIMPIYYFRGIMLAEMTGKYSEAIADYTKAIQLNNNTNYFDEKFSCIRMPKIVDVYRFRAKAFNQKGDIKKAIADYAKVLELNPSDTEASEEREKLLSGL